MSTEAEKVKQVLAYIECGSTLNPYHWLLARYEGKWTILGPYNKAVEAEQRGEGAFGNTFVVLHLDVKDIAEATKEIRKRLDKAAKRVLEETTQ